MRFVARAVGIFESEQDNHLTVVLADDDEEPSHTLQLSVALRWDDQDSALGMATYSVTVDAAATTYGGVERCELADDRFELRLSEPASQVLGIGPHVAIDLGRESAPHLALANVLRRIFDRSLPDAPVVAIGEV